MLCVRCNKRPAVVYVQKLEGGEWKSALALDSPPSAFAHTH